MTWIEKLFYGFFNKKQKPSPTPLKPHVDELEKPFKTKETQALFKYLKDIACKQILFGHQGEPLVGANQKRNNRGSDTFDMIGKYPTVYGFQLAGIEQGLEFDMKDKISFAEIKKAIPEINKSGGIVSFIWAVNNPLYPNQSAKETGLKHCISHIFDSEKAVKQLNDWIDALAGFFLSLKDENDKLIPVIFRPFHECTGTWFWWGSADNTAAEYVKLYQYTVDRLRVNGVRNVLYAYNTGNFKVKEKFMSCYPGDDYADILSFDVYDKDDNYNSGLRPNFKQAVDIICQLAKEKNKIAALAETGFKGMPVNDWWTKTLLPSIKGTGISYVLVWLNANQKDFWGSWKGHPSEPDFIEFSKEESIKFLK